ncbi:MAG: TPM domain-containing protein [Clostridia bacterium]|nr:TPM domain-containing protein [Clostridia bacterium]
MKKILTLLIALSVITTLAVTAFAYPNHTNFVCDEAGILDESTISQIKATSEDLYTKRNTRIAVCTVNSTGSESPKAYASGLYEEWSVGNGVLILLVKDQNTYYAVQSESVADVLTAEKLQNLINTYLEPGFAEGKYAEGALSASKAISAFLSSGLPEDFAEEKSSGGMPKALKVILILLIIIAVIAIGGYCLLLYAEKKQAERRSLYLEEKRRRMAREGRGGYGSSVNRGYNQGYPSQRNGAPQGYNNGQARQMPAAARRPEQYRAGGYAPAQRPRNPQNAGNHGTDAYDEYYRMQAPTSTALDPSEIRRAAQKRDKFAYPGADRQKR